jgi:hypothetical protein
VKPGLPAHVRRFLRNDVDSIEALEVLLFLRSDREQRCDVERIVRELRSTSYAILGRLEALRRRRLVVHDDRGWRYAAKGERDAVVADVAACYETVRLRVIEALYGEPDDPIRAFADAFRLKDEAEDEE